jgi:hypothetical protein
MPVSRYFFVGGVWCRLVPFVLLILLTHDFSHLKFPLIVAINPNGLNYASGAEDGYVRLHFFDKSYLDMKDPVPEADESIDGDEEFDDDTKNLQANK